MSVDKAVILWAWNPWWGEDLSITSVKLSMLCFPRAEDANANFIRPISTIESLIPSQ
jgi:hypothetical protein